MNDWYLKNGSNDMIKKLIRNNQFLSSFYRKQIEKEYQDRENQNKNAKVLTSAEQIFRNAPAEVKALINQKLTILKECQELHKQLPLPMQNDIRKQKAEAIVAGTARIAQINSFINYWQQNGKLPAVSQPFETEDIDREKLQKRLKTLKAYQRPSRWDSLSAQKRQEYQQEIDQITKALANKKEG